MITYMTEPTTTAPVASTPAPAAGAPAPAAPAAPAPLITPDAPSPGDALAKPPETDKEPTAPAEIKYEFKAPEGYDTKGLEAFAREHKLAPEVAQKLVERDLSLAKSYEEKAVAEFKNLSEKVWVQEIYNDKELGGANIDKTRLNVMKAWNEVPKPVRDEISKAGFHTNPMLVRLLNHFGQMTKEDRVAGPPNATPPSKSSSGLVGLFANMK